MSTIPSQPATIDLSRFGAWLVVLAGLLLSAGVLFHPVQGHSYYLNISWHAGFLAELRAGHWYPRWLSTTNSGLGAPSFYFYAPLPFYLSAIIETVWPLAKGPGTAPVAAAVVAVVTSGLAMFALLRALHGVVIAIPIAVIFMAMPYHFAVDLWWRAAFGEIWAYVWLPLIGLGILQQVRGQTVGILLVGVACAGMILSHLPSFVIGACGVVTMASVAVTGALVGNLDRAIVGRVVAQTTAALTIAVVSTAGYWYAALTTTDLTVMSAYMTQGWYFYENNFIFSARLANSNWVMQAIGLGLLNAVMAATCIIVIQRTAQAWVFLLALAVFAMSLFMASPWSTVIYALFPPLQRLQFPWRFLLLAEIAMAVVLAQVLVALGAGQSNRVTRRAGLITVGFASALLLALAVALPGWSRPTYTPEDVARIETYLKNRVDGEEYRTRATELTFYTDINFGRRTAPSAPHFEDAPGEAGGSAALSGLRPQPGMLVFNRYWYPDFAVRDRLTGQELITRPQPVTGLAMAEVPAGPYDLVVERRPLREETIGFRLSLTGLLLGSLWGGLGLLRRRRINAI